MSAKINRTEANRRGEETSSPDALSAYLRTVGDLPPLSVAEQNGLWSDIDAAFEQSSSGNASTATAVSSAGYQGATHVTINIYQEAPVVGDGGMRQFARMIRSEWDNLEYYGVTT